MMKVPDFLIIGAAKAGTTYLSGLLGQHPQVGISDPKEPKFFTTYWNHGWDWYERCFAAVQDRAVVGDASTQYSIVGVYPKAVQRIAEFAPQAKLIYLVRHPLARLESQWMEDANSWRTTPVPFDEAVTTKPEYIDATLYWKQYSAYRQHFDSSRILVLFFEEFVKSPESVAAECFRFLGVDDRFQVATDCAERNVSSQKRSPKPLFRPLHSLSPRLLNSISVMLPLPVRDMAKRIVKSPLKRPGWTPEVRSWVVEKVGEDSARLLKHFAKPPDFWQLQEPV